MDNKEEEAARNYCNIPLDLVIDEEERYYKNFQKYDGFKAGIEWYKSQQKTITVEKIIEIFQDYEQQLVDENGDSVDPALSSEYYEQVAEEIYSEIRFIEEVKSDTTQTTGDAYLSGFVDGLEQKDN